MAIDDYRKQLV